MHYEQKDTIANILQNLHIAALNEIQEKVLEVNDRFPQIILLSPTGSGKTLAFLLPVALELLDNEKDVQALVLVPTRELALQVEKVVREMHLSSKVNCCYGGHSMQTEIQNLIEPPSILIGTPGRIADHLRKNTFNAKKIHFLVLDEFDKSLEMGFMNEMEFILDNLPNIRKRILTSATNLAHIPDFTGINSPMVLNYLKDQVSDCLVLKFVKASGKDKLDILFRLLCSFSNQSSLVFCNHREAVERISELLRQRGVIHGILHGGMDQDERIRSLIKFKNGSFSILIATDLAARGLDISTIKNVVHYQLPTQSQTFIHRNGTEQPGSRPVGLPIWCCQNWNQFLLFIEYEPLMELLPENVSSLEPPIWDTLYVSAGKKDKVNKSDIVGFLLKKGGIEMEDLGLIEILDYTAYVAVRKNKISTLLQKIKGESLKKEKGSNSVGILICMYSKFGRKILCQLLYSLLLPNEMLNNGLSLF